MSVETNPHVVQERGHRSRPEVLKDKLQTAMPTSVLGFPMTSCFAAYLAFVITLGIIAKLCMLRKGVASALGHRSQRSYPCIRPARLASIHAITAWTQSSLYVGTTRSIGALAAVYSIMKGLGLWQKPKPKALDPREKLHAFYDLSKVCQHVTAPCGCLATLRHSTCRNKAPPWAQSRPLL